MPHINKSHHLTNAFILVFLLVQVVVPLRYYVGTGARDERFSWRMFSSVDRKICRAAGAGQGPSRQSLTEKGFME